MNNNINTQPLLNELNNIINNSIQSKLNALIERNNLLEETHQKLVSLPSVKNFFDNQIVTNECKCSCDNTMDNNKLLYNIEEKINLYFKNTNDLFNKLFIEINELKNEVKNLKNIEKENIKLEIEEVTCPKIETIHLEEEEELEEQEELEEEELEEEEEDVKSIETETKEENDPEEELFEIEIDDITYCTTDEDNGIIYKLDEEGNVGEKVGYLKDGEAYFD